MKISQQAELIRAALDSWAASEKGKAAIVFDEMELWENMFTSVSAPRVLLCYQGERVRGDFSVAAIMGRVDRQWVVAVTRGRGLNAERGDSLTTTKGNARPFYDLVEEARDIIRGLTGVSVESPVDFMGMEAAQRPDALTDAYLIRFSVADDLPRIVSAPPEYASPIDENPTTLQTIYTFCPTVPDFISNNSVLPCTNQTPTVATFAGNPAVTYNVDFTLAGIYEGKAYSGGTPINGDRVISGGTPSADENNIVKLEVSSPAATYYLNNGRPTLPGHGFCIPVEQTFTIPITGGATLTLTLDSVFPYRESTNFNEDVITGYAGILPNWGQWISITSTSIVGT